MSYKVDPDNNRKMIPKTQVIKDAYGRALAAAAYPARHPRPTYILVNKPGTYAFAYESGSIGTYVTGAFVDDAAGPIRMDIQPIAWEQTDGTATVGDVTFVYRGDVG